MFIFLVGEPAARLLQFDRAAIAAGEWWRILTGHWTHFGRQHLLWDVLTFAALGVACELRDRRRFLATVIAAAVTISAVAWLAHPSLPTLRGLSGIDTALFALLTVDVLREGVARQQHRTVAIAAAFLLLLAAKLIVESVAGVTLFVDARTASFVPVPLAHLAGAATGAVFGIVRRS